MTVGQLLRSPFARTFPANLPNQALGTAPIGLRYLVDLATHRAPTSSL